MIRILVAAALLASLAACNTVEGVGRDIGAVGKTISGVSYDARHRPRPVYTQQPYKQPYYVY